MFLKYLVEKYMEKQGEMNLSHETYGEDDLLKDIGEQKMNVRHLDYHKTVMAKGLSKKGKITILDNGDLMLGKKKTKTTSAPSTEQGSLF